MTTCIFGGTFNPVHNGHIRLAVNAKRLLQPDRTLLIPSFIPPHKQADRLVDGIHRYEMAKIAAEIIGCEVSDIELKRGDVSYSVYTLEELKNAGAGDIFFLMGSDMFLSLETWYRFNRIMELAVPVTAPRHKDELAGLQDHSRKLRELYGADSIVCDFEVTDISSTSLRKALVSGENVEKYIPSTIMKYIRDNRLYGVGRTETI